MTTRCYVNAWQQRHPALVESRNVLNATYGAHLQHGGSQAFRTHSKRLCNPLARPSLHMLSDKTKSYHALGPAKSVAKSLLASGRHVADDPIRSFTLQTKPEALLCTRSHPLRVWCKVGPRYICTVPASLSQIPDGIPSSEQPEPELGLLRTTSFE